MLVATAPHSVMYAHRMEAPPLVKAPGPSALLGLSGVREFQRDPLTYFSRIRDEWGDVMRRRVGPLVLYTIHEPALVKDLFARTSVFTKRGLMDDLIPLLGRSMLSADGDRWQERRKLLGPAFAARSIDDLERRLTEIVGDAVEAWGADDEIELGRACQALTLRVAAEIFFGFRDDALCREVGELTDRVTEELFKRNKRVLRVPLSWPTPSNRRYLDICTRLRKALASRLDPTAGVLGAVNLRTLSEEAILDEAVTLLIAGHETTASSLAWALWFLAERPALQTRIREDEGRTWLDAVINETLRLRAPGWLMMRRAAEDTALGPYSIPKGAFVSVCTWSLHRHPRYWANAEQFDPGRFLERRDHPAFVPFGSGPRTCVGRSFALREMRVALVACLGRFTLESVGEAPPVRADMTLRPGGPLRVRIGAVRNRSDD